MVFRRLRGVLGAGLPGTDLAGRTRDGDSPDDERVGFGQVQDGQGPCCPASR